MACSESSPPPLSVGSNQWPGYEPLHLAEKLDLHDGYPIKLVELTSATDVMNAFKYGQLDVAALTLDEVLLLAEDVSDLIVFLVMDISNGADKLIAKFYIKTLADLVN
jgi:NitT/TauT family transport system substrate-binding protein